MSVAVSFASFPWMGTAHYYDVVVGDAGNGNAAWYKPEPKQAADEIRGRVAFWRGMHGGR